MTKINLPREYKRRSKISMLSVFVLDQEQVKSPGQVLLWLWVNVWPLLGVNQGCSGTCPGGFGSNDLGESGLVQHGSRFKSKGLIGQRRRFKTFGRTNILFNKKFDLILLLSLFSIFSIVHVLVNCLPLKRFFVPKHLTFRLPAK